MNKMREYERGREDGLDLARRIVKEGGLEALERECKFRGVTGIHTSLAAKDLDKASQKIKEMTIDTFTILCIAAVHDEFGSILGHWLVPIFAPIGLGFWQIAVALIAGISAKEVVVSSCAVLFGIPNINSGAGMDTLVGILGAAGFGQLNAFCLMIFCLLYVPCAAALATIRKESGSTRWMLFSALFQLVVAWAVTFVVYRVGLLL